jgi:hypothetical protein
MQIATATRLVSNPNAAATPSGQYELAMDAPAQASASACAHEAIGLALGRDFALFGLTPPIEHLYAQSPLQRGWLAARARPARPTPCHSHTALWLALRTHAWARGRSFEEVQLTPNYLRQLEVSHCPITRVPLDGSNRSVDRVRNDAGYAAGHLAVMSQHANHVKAQRDQAALNEMAASAAAGPIHRIGGLDAQAWQRLAVLTSFVTPLPHAQAAAMALHVLPPNRLRMFNPIQALQALVTRQFLKPGWSARLARLEALLPGDALRSDFNRFVLALAPRALEAAELPSAEQRRWALEDAWGLALVQKRWQRLATPLSAEQARDLVERLAALRLATLSVQSHAPQGSTEGWALESQGYQALAA